MSDLEVQGEQKLLLLRSCVNRQLKLRIRDAAKNRHRENRQKEYLHDKAEAEQLQSLLDQINRALKAVRKNRSTEVAS